MPTLLSFVGQNRRLRRSPSIRRPAQSPGDPRSRIWRASRCDSTTLYKTWSTQCPRLAGADQRFRILRLRRQVNTRLALLNLLHHCNKLSPSSVTRFWTKISTEGCVAQKIATGVFRQKICFLKNPKSCPTFGPLLTEYLSLWKCTFKNRPIYSYCLPLSSPSSFAYAFN